MTPPGPLLTFPRFELVPYRVRGYPELQTQRPQGTAAQLDAGRIDLADVRPALLAGLERVGAALHQRLTIFSGYRTDAYSEAVGGFAGDPHTRGIAADVNVGGTPIGNVPRALRLLRAQGLVSGAQPGFYKGAPDPAHVQLSSGAGANANITLEQLWIDAGGAPKMARTMAAIALAESGGDPNAVNASSGATGLWQIHPGGDQYKDPMTNARTAVAKLRSQGLGAWEAYTNGAYRAYLQRAPGATVAGGVAPGTAPRTRPGGGPPGSDDAALASWKDWLDNPGTNPLWLESHVFGWNPLHIFTDAAGAVSDVGSFLKWIAWLFHPRNILRVVEFSAGAGLMALGLWTSVKVFEGEPAPNPAKGVARAVELTPQGRELKAVRAGKSQARTKRRSEQFRASRARARTKESTRLSNRDFEREAKRSGRGPGTDIPF